MIVLLEIRFLKMNCLKVTLRSKDIEEFRKMFKIIINQLWVIVVKLITYFLENC
jgi:hypothetical protein